MSQSIATHSQTESKERLRLWLRFIKLTRSIDERLREGLREDFGATMSRFDLMAALARTDTGLKMTEISSALCISNANVTGLVDRLSAEGLVERKSVEGDRRVSRVQLTLTGHKEFAKQAQAHEVWVNDALGSFSHSEASELRERLEQAIGELENTSLR